MLHLAGLGYSFLFVSNFSKIDAEVKFNVGEYICFLGSHNEIFL